MSGDEERLARVGLSRLSEPKDAARALVAERGPVSVWRSLLRDDGSVPGRVRDQALARGLDPTMPDRDLCRGAAIGARLVIPGDDEWPDGLEVLDAAQPLCLWLRGPVSLDLAAGRSVAVVGSRAATSYGVHVAAELGHGLVSLGYAVVSGAAYGIDGAAHRGALAGAGVTIAVLACGVDVTYPRSHDTLLRRIADEGLVISEWPPGCAPIGHRFLSRNRLIAAMTQGTVVVEAAARSGALRTAADASEFGRTLMAVPGPVTSAMSVGANGVLREMAGHCVTDARDVDALLGGLDPGSIASPRGLVQPRDALSEGHRRVLESVPVRRAQPPARIARTAGLELDYVRSALGGLLTDGFVERTESGFRLSAAERRRRGCEAPDQPALIGDTGGGA